MFPGTAIHLSLMTFMNLIIPKDALYSSIGAETMRAKTLSRKKRVQTEYTDFKKLGMGSSGKDRPYKKSTPKNSEEQSAKTLKRGVENKWRGMLSYRKLVEKWREG